MRYAAYPRIIASSIGLMLLPLAAFAQAPVTLSPVEKRVFLGTSGLPLASGCVFTYIAGTTTNQATYVDSGGITTNTNPVILDAAGRADIWLDTTKSYKFKIVSAGGVNCAAGVTQYTVDAITALGATSILGANNVWSGNNTANGIWTFTQPIVGSITGTSSSTNLTGPSTNTGVQTFTGQVDINTSQTSANYKLEVSQTPANFAAPFHIMGPSQQGTDTGLYIWSGAADGGQMAAGCAPDPAGSGQYVQKAASGFCNQIHFGGGNNIEIFGDSGHGVGAAFTATRRAFSSGAQFLFSGGTATLPGIAFQAENPLNGTGFFYTGDPGIGFALCSAGGACNGGGGGNGVEQFRWINNEFKPSVDNVYTLGDATHRVNQINVTTVECGTSGNITCIQSDGSNNLFIGNANVGTGGITIVPGNGSVNLNKGLHPVNGTGYQATSGTAGCTTGAAVGAACTVVVNWSSAFVDANYTPHCDGLLITSGVPVNGGITNVAAGSVTFQTVAATAVAAKFTNIACSAFHN